MSDEQVEVGDGYLMDSSYLASDPPADTLTTTIAKVLGSRMALGTSGRYIAYETPEALAAAVVSVLATHNEHAAADALRDAANRWQQGEWSDVSLPVHKRGPIAVGQAVTNWLRDRADRLAAVSPTPPTRGRGPRPCPQYLNGRVCALNNFHPGDHEWTWTRPVPPTHTNTESDNDD